MNFAGKRVIDLGAEAADVDIDHVGVAVEVHVPDLLGDERPRQARRPARRASRVSRLNSLGVRSSWRPARLADEPERVDLQIRDAEDLLLPGAVPRRRTERTRARNSEKANGLTR